MKTILTVATALVTGLFFSSSAIAEDAKPAEWLFVHTAQSAEMTSATTLVMPATRDIFAFTDRPNRQHGYMNAHEFVTFWDEGEGDTFKADPPNAVLPWVDGGEMKEAEVLIIGAETVGLGREISYEVKMLAGDMPVDVANNASFFMDSFYFPLVVNFVLHGALTLFFLCVFFRFFSVVPILKTKRPHPPTAVLIT